MQPKGAPRAGGQTSQQRAAHATGGPPPWSRLRHDWGDKGGPFVFPKEVTQTQILLKDQKTSIRKVCFDFFCFRPGFELYFVLFLRSCLHYTGISWRIESFTILTWKPILLLLSSIPVSLFSGAALLCIQQVLISLLFVFSLISCVFKGLLQFALQHRILLAQRFKLFFVFQFFLRHRVDQSMQLLIGLPQTVPFEFSRLQVQL